MRNGMDFPPKQKKAEPESDPADLSEKEKIAAEAAWIEEEARKVFLEIADEVRAAGVEPNELGETWNNAHKTYVRMLGIARKYPEVSAKEREDLVHLQKRLIRELSTTSAENVGEAVERLIASRTHEHKAEESGSSAVHLQEDVEQEPDAIPIHIDTVSEASDEAVEERVEVANENTAPEAASAVETEAAPEPADDADIVMVNPVLTKIAMGGKKMKVPKEKKTKKERKSVSEGGTVYKGMVFSEPEPWMEKKEVQPQPVDTGPESVVIRGASDTRAELKHTLRRSVEQINEEIEAKRMIIKSLEETARHKHGTAADAVEGEILSTENDVRSLENERRTVNEVQNLKGANENESESVATPEVPIEAAQEPAVTARDFGPGVSDMMAIKAERMQAKGRKKRRNIFSSFMAGVMAVAAGGSAPKPTQRERAYTQPVPATAPRFERQQVHHWVKTPSTMVSIEGNDEGIDSLFEKMSAELNSMYRDGHIPNAVTKKLMETDAHELSVALGFVDGKYAAPMQPRDSLEVNADGQLIFHDSTKGPDHGQVLMESTFGGAKVKNTYHWAHPHGGKLEHKPGKTIHKATVHTAEHVNADPDRSAEIAASYARQHADYKQSMEEHGFAIDTNGPGTYSPKASETRSESVAPAAKATVETPAKASEAGTSVESKNIHGIEVDTHAPHLYEDAYGKLIVYGGEYKDQLTFVDQFFKQPENFGKTVLTLSGTPDPMTGQPDVIPYISNESGKYGPDLIIRDEQGTPIPPPTNNDLVKKLS